MELPALSNGGSSILWAGQAAPTDDIKLSKLNCVCIHRYLPIDNVCVLTIDSYSFIEGHPWSQIASIHKAVAIRKLSPHKDITGVGSLAEELNKFKLSQVQKKNSIKKKIGAYESNTIEKIYQWVLIDNVISIIFM